jgi:hypothetical protein
MKIGLLLLLALPSFTFAKETDNLTGRYKQLEDSTAIMDAEMNKRLATLVDEANSNKISCIQGIEIRRLFYSENKETLFIGSLETYAEKNDKVAKRKASPSNSVYEGVLAKGMFFDKIDLSSTVVINGQQIGTDKFGHFIDQGYRYYTDFRKRDGQATQLYETLRSSTSSESEYGKKSTGVVSYGDSMANFKGILFYHNLTEGQTPYLRCANGKWSISRPFSWAEYVDAGWDEGINCSQIVGSKRDGSVDPKDDTETAKRRATYDANLKKLEENAARANRSQNYRCPVDEQSCADMKKRYAGYDNFILSPECRAVGKAATSSSKAGSTSSGGSSGAAGGKR